MAEIVRCKNCVFWEEVLYVGRCNGIENGLVREYTKPRDFCSYGIPKDTDDSDKTVQCGDCKHLVFSDCYAECGAGHKGIVHPDDSCPYGKRKDGAEE